MSVYVGLDCGGSSTRILAVNASGEILHQGQAGSANLSSTPERLLMSNLRRASDGCPEATQVCGCFAGLLTAQDRSRALEHLHRIFPLATLRAEPDYAAALFANDPIPDLCVICGTGSLICSWRNGRVVKTGGGGYIVGDAGSAYQFGRDLLRHYLYSDEPISDRGLTAILETFGTEDRETIVSRIYRSAAPAPLLAKLAKVIGHDANDGIPFAVASLRNNMNELADQCVLHLKRFHGMENNHLEKLSIVLAGGLWRPGSAYRDAFEGCLRDKLDMARLEIVLTRNPPVKGALKLAMEPF